MPYPPRTTVFAVAFQAKPIRGAKLLRSGFTNVDDAPFWPATTGTTAPGELNDGLVRNSRATFRFTSKLLISVIGDTYSYRRPKLKLKLPRTRHSSCANKSQEFPRK